MASNLLLSSSSKSSSKLSNESATNVVDLLVKCGTEFKNQSVAALNNLCKYETLRTTPSIPSSLGPAAVAAESIPTPLTESSCPIKSAVNSLCRALPAAISSCSSAASSSASSSPSFIDPSELMRSLCEMTKRPFPILLDCRPYTEFNNQHIKDSVHLNCRDKLIKKRLQMQKITIRDLISCEATKSKLDSAVGSPTTTAALTSTDEEQGTTLASARRLSTASLAKAAAAAAVVTSSQPCLQRAAATDTENDENIIVIYDDTTSDDKDLLAESNPLKIVQENIKKAGISKECKILKGGFKQFAAMCPDLCRSEMKKTNCNSSSLYEQMQDQHQSTIDNTTMTEITPYLYLGNEMDAKNVAKLDQLGIHYVLNVTKNVPFYDMPDKASSKFVFKRISVNDCLTQSLKEHFQEAIDFIEEARSNNSKVLVHCQAGVSRSPTIVIAYLMQRRGISINEAYQRVRELRPIVSPNIVFMSQLMDFENKLKAQQFASIFANCSGSVNTSSTSLDDKSGNDVTSSAAESANKSAIECN